MDCPVYDGMKKTSTVLAQTTSGNEVQVTDTINAYFVRVRLDKAGQTKLATWTAAASASGEIK